MKLAAVAVGLLPEVERVCLEIAPMSGINPTRGNSGTFFADADPAAYVTGFEMPGPSRRYPRAPRAGVRKPPGKEGAGEWGTRLSGLYGDLVGTDGAV